MYKRQLWQLIGSTATKQSSDFVVDIYRLIRAYSGAAISASQNLTDYDSDAGRVILNTSKTKILLNLETDEARKAQRLSNLSSMEAHSITPVSYTHLDVYKRQSQGTRLTFPIDAFRPTLPPTSRSRAWQSRLYASSVLL